MNRDTAQRLHYYIRPTQSINVPCLVFAVVMAGYVCHALLAVDFSELLAALK